MHVPRTDQLQARSRRSSRSERETTHGRADLASSDGGADARRTALESGADAAGAAGRRPLRSALAAPGTARCARQVGEDRSVLGRRARGLEVRLGRQAAAQPRQPGPAALLDRQLLRVREPASPLVDVRAAPVVGPEAGRRLRRRDRSRARDAAGTDTRRPGRGRGSGLDRAGWSRAALRCPCRRARLGTPGRDLDRRAGARRHPAVRRRAPSRGLRRAALAVAGEAGHQAPAHRHPSNGRHPVPCGVPAAAEADGAGRGRRRRGHSGGPSAGRDARGRLRARPRHRPLVGFPLPHRRRGDRRRCRPGCLSGEGRRGRGRTGRAPAAAAVGGGRSATRPAPSRTACASDRRGVGDVRDDLAPRAGGVRPGGGGAGR